MANIGLDSKVTIMMVRNVLGYPSTDLGTLCSCENINKWAKYKPVRHNFTFDRPSDWWKAIDHQCGLSVPSAFGSKSLIELARSGQKMWEYSPPVGGSGSPYRLGDFRGYNHNAINPVRVTAFPTVAYQDVTPNISGAINKQAVSSDNLSLTDISGAFPVSDTYPGIIVSRTDQETGQLVTGNELFSQRDGEVNVPISKLLTDRDYDFIYVLSEKKQTTFGPITDDQSYYIVIPSDIAVQRVRIMSGGIMCYPTASIQGVRAKYTLRFVNTSSTEVVTVTNVYVYLVYSDFVFGESTLEAGETTIPLADQRIVKGTDTVVTGEQAGALPDFPTRGGKIIVVFYYMARQHKFEAMFEES